MRLLVAICLCVLPVTYAWPQATPNVVLCMADDLGWGDTGYNGNSVVRTPHLDAMAKSGIQFDRWYAGAPVCSPTRGNCLTGRHPARLGIPTANQGRLQPSEQTLGERLQKAGYMTGHFGKWHLGTLTTNMKDSNRGRPGDRSNFSPPWANGFDVCFSTEAKVPTYNPMHRPRDVQDLRYGWAPVSRDRSIPYGTHYFDQSGRVITDNLRGDDSRIMMDRAIPFIRDAVAAERPFFAVIWFHAPHLPVVAGPKHASLYSELSWREQMYFGCITALDEQIGRLRTELDRLGVADNTMIWFSSDNGPENRTPGTTRMLRARKRSLYEGGIRVPGLMTWPAMFKRPKTIHAPCHTGDYYPTILSALGITTHPQILDGVDLLPIIRGEQANRDAVIHFQYGSQAAVVADRYKLYRARPNQTWELYDLVSDPAETIDLSKRNPAVLDRLSHSYVRWQESLTP